MKTEKAFTLIELIIVIVVIAVSVSGVAIAMNQALRNMGNATYMSTAAQLALSEAERVYRLAFASVADENRGSPASYTDNFANYSREVRVDSIDTAQPNLGSDAAMANYKVVEIRVYNSAINYVSIKFLKTKFSTT